MNSLIPYSSLFIAYSLPGSADYRRGQRRVCEAPAGYCPTDHARERFPSLVFLILSGTRHLFPALFKSAVHLPPHLLPVLDTIHSPILPYRSRDFLIDYRFPNTGNFCIITFLFYSPVKILSIFPCVFGQICQIYQIFFSIIRIICNDFPI